MNALLLIGLAGMAASASLIILAQEQMLRRERRRRRILRRQVDTLARLARADWEGGAA
jgi:hypothetical protein